MKEYIFFSCSLISVTLCFLCICNFRITP